ncbi:hypothetical protein MLD38_015814 [Melastoma candidum]|uniref:Uncharacterized protein n=1 Tax=Melastoma candidum TaxID=119954 RepID=A0ACB9RIJ9_9MYRT|nr:hypothetical protein MLD38_015814 [Melastoma candidum]
MGCVYSKGSAVNDSRENMKGEGLSSSRRLRELKNSRLDSSRGASGYGLKDKVSDVDVMLIDRKVNGSVRLCDDPLQKSGDDLGRFEKQRREKGEEGVVAAYESIRRVPKATEGEQVAAGWPTWLSAAAGEAVRGWLPRRADTFEKLDKIGQGTYSSVYRARDVVSNKIVALKRVRFDNLDPESVKFMAREILYLRRLDHPNIIKLEGLITSRMSCSLYLVFEYMEHDLTGLASRPGLKFTEPQIKCYMKQLLSGLDHCHRHGILHRDIKGSNLLIDNNGILKIADFGLASAFDPNRTVPLTSRVVTLWYRPPELLLGATHYGSEVDLWSSGCILGELYTGKPILPGKTEVEQLHKIFKLCGSPSDDDWLHLPHATMFKPPHPYRRCVTEMFKELPPAAVGLIETLLSVDPTKRGTSALALRSEFFTTSPLPCDPSSLPKCPPSKEIDMKLREEEARRKAAAGGNGDLGNKGARKGWSSFVDNAETVQVKQSTSHSRDKTVSGFLVAPPKQPFTSKETRRDGVSEYHFRPSHSGPLVPGSTYVKATRPLAHPSTAWKNANLSSRSGNVGSRTSLAGDSRGKSGPLYQDSSNLATGRFSGPIRDTETARRYDNRPYTGMKFDSRAMDDEAATRREQNPYVVKPGGNKVYVSGPLLVPSNNVEQLLKEHDRRIQDYARRAKMDRARFDRDRD